MQASSYASSQIEAKSHHRKADDECDQKNAGPIECAGHFEERENAPQNWRQDRGQSDERAEAELHWGIIDRRSVLDLPLLVRGSSWQLVNGRRASGLAFPRRACER